MVKTAVSCVSLLIEKNSVIKEWHKSYGGTEVRSGKFVTSVKDGNLCSGGGVENAAN